MGGGAIEQCPPPKYATAYTVELGITRSFVQALWKYFYLATHHLT